MDLSVVDCIIIAAKGLNLFYFFTFIYLQRVLEDNTLHNWYFSWIIIYMIIHIFLWETYQGRKGKLRGETAFKIQHEKGFAPQFSETYIHGL